MTAAPGASLRDLLNAIDEKLRGDEPELEVHEGVLNNQEKGLRVVQRWAALHLPGALQGFVSGESPTDLKDLIMNANMKDLEKLRLFIHTGEATRAPTPTRRTQTIEPKHYIGVLGILAHRVSELLDPSITCIYCGRSEGLKKCDTCDNYLHHFCMTKSSPIIEHELSVGERLCIKCAKVWVAKKKEELPLESLKTICKEIGEKHKGNIQQLRARLKKYDTWAPLDPVYTLPAELFSVGDWWTTSQAAIGFARLTQGEDQGSSDDNTTNQKAADTTTHERPDLSASDDGAGTGTTSSSSTHAAKKPKGKGKIVKKVTFKENNTMVWETAPSSTSSGAATPSTATPSGTTTPTQPSSTAPRVSILGAAAAAAKQVCPFLKPLNP